MKEGRREKGKEEGSKGKKAGREEGERKEGKTEGRKGDGGWKGGKERRKGGRKVGGREERR